MSLFLKLFLSVCTVSLTLSSAALAGYAGHLEKIKAGKTVRVCHWPAYYGISFVNSNPTL